MLSLINFLTLFVSLISLSEATSGQDFIGVPNGCFKTYDKNTVCLRESTDKKISLFVFLSPRCKVSREYVFTIEELKNQYSEGIRVYGVISGSHHDKADIDLFVRLYNIDFPIILDSDFEIRNSLGAEVAPEAFLFSPTGILRYRGAIDDRASSKGNGSEVRNTYLLDALDALINKQFIAVNHTQAYGCNLVPKVKIKAK